VTEHDMLAEIFQIYQPQPVRAHPGFRVYYHPTTQAIICFSQDELNYPYVQTTEQIYMSGRLDLYRIQNGELVKRNQHHANRLQLMPNGVTFASIHNDMQFAVPLDYGERKDFWDASTY
jgi:hypothetical protein